MEDRQLPEHYMIYNAYKTITVYVWMNFRAQLFLHCLHGLIDRVQRTMASANKSDCKPHDEWK